MSKDRTVYKAISSDLVGKEIELIKINAEGAEDWNYTVGAVTEIDWQSESVTILVKSIPSHHRDYIGKTTNFPIGGSWGYVFTQEREWD